MYSLEEIADEFANTLHAELDYRREARNAERFKQNFSDESDLYIPQVHWAYTTKRVLTLERTTG
jgi:ubiquinone biosynthesis protein